MAICEISNGRYTAAVDSQGAELKSLRKAEDGREYIWSGDAEYWSGTSPVLFPFIGGLKNGEYRTGGSTYGMTKHGFAKNREFKLLSQEAGELWFVLESDEETRKNYPFAFRLEVGYRLEEHTLKVMWRVENPSEKDTLYFSVGGHPGLNCPMYTGGKKKNYYLKFDTEECIRSTVIGEDGLACSNRIIYELEDGLLPITEDLFDYDTVVLEDSQVHSISILTPDKKPYLTTTFHTPVVAIWSPVQKKAPFICIEPWCGLCDYTDFTGTLEERKWENKLEPGKRFLSGFEITVEE